MERLESYFQNHGIKYKRSEDADFVKYNLVALEENKVPIQIWCGIGDSFGRNSIYVNQYGNYINYELYKDAEQFIEDVDNVLRASVNLLSTIQDDKVVTNTYWFIYPKKVDMNPYMVAESIGDSSMFKHKSVVEHSFQPWIIE